MHLWPVRLLHTSSHTVIALCVPSRTVHTTGFDNRWKSERQVQGSNFDSQRTFRSIRNRFQFVANTIISNIAEGAEARCVPARAYSSYALHSFGQQFCVAALGSSSAKQLQLYFQPIVGLLDSCLNAPCLFRMPVRTSLVKLFEYVKCASSPGTQDASHDDLAACESPCRSQFSVFLRPLVLSRCTISSQENLNFQIFRRQFARFSRWKTPINHMNLHDDQSLVTRLQLSEPKLPEWRFPL